MKILAFESSCDETAVAVVEDGRTVLSDAIASQADLHALYGGVVPEIASRKHVEAIAALTDQALRQAGCEKSDIDAVAVTYAPGLIGAVLVGLSFAKSVAFALGVPLIPVHHIRGHIAANYLAFPELEPPFLALAISGGNTMIVDVRDYTDMEILGATRDDAAGECFDKAARVLGLPYPGGAPMDALARQSPGGVYTLPHAHVDGAELDMSFSGLKTAVVNLAHHAQQVGESLDRAALARDFAQAVSDTLVPRAMEAAKQTGRTVLCAAGGAKHSAASLLCRLHGPGHQCIADSLGEVPSQRCPVQRLPHLLSMVGQVHHRRLEAGEAHVQLCPVHMGVRQGVHPARGLPGQGVHGGAAGIGQAQHPGRLVEALPCCVIPGGAQNLHIRVVPDVHDHCVASGDGQGQEGRLQFRKGQVIGGDVAPDVVHRDQGHPQGKGHRLGEAEAHQHRADEPRGIGHCHRVDVGLLTARLPQSLVRQGGNGLHMLAGGDLRHHAAVQGVEVRLGGDGIGQDRAPVLHHGHRCLVAGGLKGQNFHDLSLSFPSLLPGYSLARRPIWIKGDADISAEFIRRKGTGIDKAVLLHQGGLVHFPLRPVQGLVGHAEHLRVIPGGPGAVAGIEAQPPLCHGRVRGVARDLTLSEDHIAPLRLPELLQDHGAQAAVPAVCGHAQIVQQGPAGVAQP